MKTSKRFLKVIKIGVIVTVFGSIACADYFYADMYSAFFPEISKVSKSNEKFFFTNYFPYGQREYDYNANKMDDSLNVDSWVAHSNNKIARSSFVDRLYTNKNLGSMANELKKKKFTSEAEYLNFLQKIDPLLNIKNENYWEPTPPKDTSLIKSHYPIIENQFAKCTVDFLKERYLYLLTKLSSSIGDHDQTIKYYDFYQSKLSGNTFVSDWISSKYAGALYHDGQLVKSFYEFSKLYGHSVSRKDEADLSVRVYHIPWSEEVIQLCKSPTEKMNAYALAAIQPMSDGLYFLEKMYEIDPKSETLRLVVTREINKNEEMYYMPLNNIGEKEAWFGDDFRDVDSSYTASKMYLNSLHDFVLKAISENKVSDTDFWLMSSAYLYYVGGDIVKANEELDKVTGQFAQNSILQKQYDIMSVLFDLKGSIPYDESNFVSIYDKIEKFTIMNSERDVSVMKIISGNLVEYLNKVGVNSEQAKSSKSWFSGCGKSNISADSSLGKLTVARKFFAESLSKIYPEYREVGDDYKVFYGYTGWGRQTFLDTLSTDVLYSAVHLMEDEKKSALDSKLINLSKINPNELYLAYGRKLMLDHKFEEALTEYKKIDPTFLKSIFENIAMKDGPKAYMKSLEYKIVPDPITYISEIVSLQKSTISDPNDADSWYGLGLALVNISYHGNAWILSKSSRSSAEMEYGPKNDEEYYGNKSAVVSLKKALALTKEKESGAKVAFIGAMAERNQYLYLFYKNQPADYEKQEAYAQAQEAELNSKFRTFFMELKNRFSGTSYEKMIINECTEYSEYLNQIQ